MHVGTGLRSTGKIQASLGAAEGEAPTAAQVASTSQLAGQPPAAEVNGVHAAAQSFEGHAAHGMHAVGDSGMATLRTSCGEPGASHHKDVGGSLSGMHDDDVCGLGDMDGDAGGCAAHLLPHDVRAT